MKDKNKQRNEGRMMNEQMRYLTLHIVFSPVFKKPLDGEIETKFCER